MDFEGKVVSVLQPVSGTSARGEWKKQEVIFEQDGEYSRKVCVSFWGDKAQDAAGLREGDRVSVSANVESREFNGRWFTEVRAWRLSRGASPQAGVSSQSHGAMAGAAASAPAAAAGFAPVSEEEPYKEDNFDDLPF